MAIDLAAEGPGHPRQIGRNARRWWRRNGGMAPAMEGLPWRSPTSVLGLPDGVEPLHFTPLW
jgi:hypothetical protein